MQTQDTVTPNQPHSNECPYNQFIFDDPVMEDGVQVIYFYGKEKQKYTKNVVSAKQKFTKKIVSANVNSMENNNKKKKVV